MSFGEITLKSIHFDKTGHNRRKDGIQNKHLSRIQCSKVIQIPFWGVSCWISRRANWSVYMISPNSEFRWKSTKKTKPTGSWPDAEHDVSMRNNLVCLVLLSSHSSSFGVTSSSSLKHLFAINRGLISPFHLTHSTPSHLRIVWDTMIQQWRDGKSQVRIGEGEWCEALGKKEIILREARMLALLYLFSTSTLEWSTHILL